MSEHILFLTGRLAKTRLTKVLNAMQPTEFTYAIHDVGVKVAGLMTADLIRRRLPDALEAARVVVPGRFRGDLEALSDHYRVPFERGPDDLTDLPEFLGGKAMARDLTGYDVRIFAEIVEAPELDLAGILARAADYRRAGADVIDLGCLPETPFPHLEEAVAALGKAGYTVSVDSADPDELLRGGRAGADYLLSLNEDTLGIAREVDAVPILIPTPDGGLDSLLRAMDGLDKAGRKYIVDSILDPIHFGFGESLLRYAELRQRRPEAEILMGTGNLTELTDADSSGVTAALMGIASELGITNVLVVQVSPHCRRSVQEHDAARRLMYAARADGNMPNNYSNGLLCLRSRKPFPYGPDEIAETAKLISDANFRIEVAEDGIHCYNRAGHQLATDPFELFPRLGVEKDGAHAFYLGYEAARAQVAWQLGKRYVQDEPLDWGAAVDREEVELSRFKEAGETLQARRKARRKSGGTS